MFISGCSSGIGAACARRYAKCDYRLVLVARRQENLDHLADELGRSRTEVLAVDLRDRTATESAIEGLPTEYRNVCILINNAGLALGLEPAHLAHIEDMDTMIDTNIKPLVHLTRTLLPGMVARNQGHIVNIGSVAGTYPYPGGHVYGGTKAFVRQFSLNLRADLLGTKVRVTTIEPGMVNTEFSLVRYRGNHAKATSVYDGMTPMSAEDIADTIEFATSRPWHVNINRIELMATEQAFGPFAVHRNTKCP